MLQSNPYFDELKRKILAEITAEMRLADSNGLSLYSRKVINMQGCIGTARNNGGASHLKVINGLEGPTQDAQRARLGTVHEVVARASGELDKSGAIQVNRGLIQGMDSESRLEWA